MLSSECVLFGDSERQATVGRIPSIDHPRLGSPLLRWTCFFPMSSRSKYAFRLAQEMFGMFGGAIDEFTFTYGQHPSKQELCF